jgi:hypothetical protein
VTLAITSDTEIRILDRLPFGAAPTRITASEAWSGTAGASGADDEGVSQNFDVMHKGQPV